MGERSDYAMEAIEFATVPSARLRAMVTLLSPDEMTPTAKRQLLALCDEAEAEAAEILAELDAEPPRPSLEGLGFTQVGRCSCGVECFKREQWSHFGQDGIDHHPNVAPESIGPWPTDSASSQGRS